MLTLLRLWVSEVLCPMGMKPADDRSVWKGDMQGLPYRPEAQQWSCQRGTGPSKNKELRRLITKNSTKSTPRQSLISMLPLQPRNGTAQRARSNVSDITSFLYTPLSHPHPSMIKVWKGFSALRSLSWLNILGALVKIPTQPTVCSPETGRYQKRWITENSE